MTQKCLYVRSTCTACCGLRRHAYAPRACKLIPTPPTPRCDVHICDAHQSKLLKHFGTLKLCVGACSFFMLDATEFHNISDLYQVQQQSSPSPLQYVPVAKKNQYNVNVCMPSFIHWWRTCCTASHSQYNGDLWLWCETWILWWSPELWDLFCTSFDRVVCSRLELYYDFMYHIIILCFSSLATWLPFLNKPIDWLIDYVYDTGLQNVIRPKQSTANVHSEHWNWTWLQIFPSPSPSPSPAKMDSSPDSIPSLTVNYTV